MSQISTLEQAIQAIEELQSQMSHTNSRMLRLTELNEEQLAEARKALGESEKAREWARNMYRVDHYGFIWRWNTDTHQYEKTTSRIGTPVLADEYVTTEKLANLSVTTAKLDNLSVTPEKIGGLAVITEKIADLAVTTRKLAHEAVTTEKLAPGSVVNEKIGDLTISWGKLDTDLQNVIASAGAHGVALSNEFGNSELIGISQKTLTESRDDLQNQIDEIVGGSASVSLSASPATIFVGEEKTITLNATTNKTATSIDITGGNISGTIHGSGMSKNGTDVITPASPGTISYEAAFVISNKTREAERSVTAVYPIFYGAQAEYDAESLAQYATPTTAVARAYTVQLDSTRRKFYLRVPKQGVAQVKSVVMGSGSEASPVSGGIVQELSDESYNVWASDDGFTGNGPQVFTVS